MLTASAPRGAPREHSLVERDASLHRKYRQGDFGARARLAERFMPLARSLAARYARSSEAKEDLEQVAYIGLLKAIDRYDLERGEFSAFAVPNILGELKRHFRDHGWAMHVPRPVQARYLELNRLSDEMHSELGHAPSVPQLVKRSGMSFEDVAEALDAGSSYSLVALEAPYGAEEESGSTLGDTVGQTDAHYELVTNGTAISPVFKALPRREQEIIRLRFFEDLKQREIGERLGISQMHVSRLLRRSLDKLRAAARA